MTYKTILVHLNDERRVAGLIGAAMSVAERSEAHVIALYVLPPAPAYAATSAGAGMIEQAMGAFREEAAKVHQAFEEACRGHAITPEWKVVEPTHGTVADVVLAHARCADLIIASQRDPDFDFSRVLDVPDSLVLESGRPVLLIPRVGKYPEIGRHVTVAWNARREGARAVFDAMPLLEAAEEVRIVWINPGKEKAAAGDLPGAEAATTLARHGVKCTTAPTTATDIGVGDVLLSGLADDGADLLVMGAWGHSRLREYVFGGATQHILDHMTVPVLLSH